MEDCRSANHSNSFVSHCTPLAFIHRADGASPPISLSITATNGSRFLDPTVTDGSLQLLRQCIVSLRTCVTMHHDWACLPLLGNLRKLSLNWGSSFDLAHFAKLARHAPMILSLSVRYSSSEYELRAGLEGDNLRPGELCILFCSTRCLQQLSDFLPSQILSIHSSNGSSRISESITATVISTPYGGTCTV